jgi:phage-related protein
MKFFYLSGVSRLRPMNAGCPEPPLVSTTSLVTLAALVGALVYLAVNPITLPCVGCDSGGVFYRCMDGTGAGTITCDAWNKGSEGVNAAAKKIMSVGEYGDELVKFATRLPQFLHDFAATILAKLKAVTAEVYERMKTVAAYVLGKYEEVKLRLEGVVFKTWAQFYDKVLAPIIAGVTDYIITPIRDLLTRIVKFAKMVLGSISDVLGRAGDIMTKAYDAVRHAAQVLSDTVRLVLVKSAALIEKVVDGVRNGINKGLGEVIGGVEDAVNTVTRGVSVAATAIENGVNVTTSAITGKISDGVNAIGDGVTKAVGGLETGINKGLQGIGNVTQGALNGVTEGVEKSVNNIGSGIIGTVDAVITETEDIINDLGNMLETTVNDTVNLINTGITAPLEDALNDSADVVRKALDGVLVPVKGVVDGLNKVGNFEINLGSLYKGKPFAALAKIDAPDAPTIRPVDIPDIPKVVVKDISIPGLKYVTPAKTPALGRARLLGSIARAQKNWTYASAGAIRNLGKPQHHPSHAHSSHTSQPAATHAAGTKGAGLGVYDSAPVSNNFDFLGCINNANDTISSMRSGGGVTGTPTPMPTQMQAPMPTPTRSEAPTVTTAPIPDVSRRLGAAVAAAGGDHIINGVALKTPQLPAMPTISLSMPSIPKLDLKIPQLTIPKPSPAGVTLKVPQVKFDLELDSKVPVIPNPVDVIGDGFSKLGALMTNFLEPVWGAFSSLYALMQSVVATIVHFVKTEITWEKLVQGVRWAAARGLEGLQALWELVYTDVVVPLVQTIIWLRDKVIVLVKEFASMVWGFLEDLQHKLAELGDAVWSKVKPALQQAGVVTAGVAMFSLGALLERLPVFNLLPCSTTSKVYIFLVTIIMFLCGSHLVFCKDLVVESVKLVVAPFRYAMRSKK